MLNRELQTTENIFSTHGSQTQIVAIMSPEENWCTWSSLRWFWAQSKGMVFWWPELLIWQKEWFPVLRKCKNNGNGDCYSLSTLKFNDLDLDLPKIINFWNRKTFEMKDVTTHISLRIKLSCHLLESISWWA